MLDGKSVAVVLGEPVESGAVEIIEIIRAMKNMNARVRLVGSPGQRYLRLKNVTLRVDVTIDKAQAADFAAVILCAGCPGAVNEHRHYHTFLRGADELRRVIGAIGRGVELLVSGGLLPDNDADVTTVIPGGDGRATGKGNLILSRDSSGLVSFIHEIARTLVVKNTGTP